MGDILTVSSECERLLDKTPIPFYTSSPYRTQATPSQAFAIVKQGEAR
jgi:hypothetical protein